MRLVVASMLPLLSSALLGCAAAKPIYAKEKFDLSEVCRAPVAVLPVAEAVLDEDTAGTVAKEYGTAEQFLQALSRQVSAEVAKGRPAPAVSADAVRGMLSVAPETAALLEPGGVVRDPEAPGAAPTTAGAAAGLARVEGLKEVRYAVVLRRVALVRRWGTAGAAPSAFSTQAEQHALNPSPGIVTVQGATITPGGAVVGGVVTSSGGYTGGTVVGGHASGGVPMAGGYTAGATVTGGTLVGGTPPMSTPTPAAPAGPAATMMTFAVLEWAVVDLETAEVVWVDRVSSSTTSLLMKVTALHEVEDGLASALGRALKPRPSATGEP